METKFTKGAWKQRRLFSAPIFIKDENTGNEWYHNEISIVDVTGRVICDIRYKTISPNEGWGHNETIEKWEANAKLIAAAPEMFEALANAVRFIKCCPELSNEERRPKGLEKWESILQKATE